MEYFCRLIHDTTFFPTIVGALAAIISGICTVLLAEYLKSRRQRAEITDLKSQLMSEIESLKKQIASKTITVQKAIPYLDKNQFLNPSAPLFVMYCFDNYMNKLFYKFEEKERIHIHLIYEHLKETDKILQGMENQFMKFLQLDGINQFDVCKTRLNEVLTTYSNISLKIDELLEKKVKNPFQVPQKST